GASGALRAKVPQRRRGPRPRSRRRLTCWGAATRWPEQLGDAEAVELAVACPADKRLPLVRSESKNRPMRILAVANADVAAWQMGYFDAVAVGEAEGTLAP